MLKTNRKQPTDCGLPLSQNIVHEILQNWMNTCRNVKIVLFFKLKECFSEERNKNIKVKSFKESFIYSVLDLKWFSFRYFRVNVKIATLYSFNMFIKHSQTVIMPSVILVYTSELYTTKRQNIFYIVY